MIIVLPCKDKRAARNKAMNGLYDEKRDLFLVDIETGIINIMPHLSSRVKMVKVVATIEETE